MPSNNKFYTKTREQLFEMYMDSLKDNELPWEKPWKSAEIFCPNNPLSKTQYRGINRMLLGLICMKENLADNRWATFNQIRDTKGIYHPDEKWHLQADSKGIPVELWKIRKKETKQLLDFEEYNRIIRDDPDEAANYELYARTYYVYNYSFIDGAPELKQEVSKTVSIPLLQEFCDETLRNMGVGLEHKGSQAYYSPNEDKIVLPEISDFKTAKDYYATRLHETAHSTGAEKRMNRDLSGGFGSENYAEEELRAEIASSLLFADLKVSTTAKMLDNHKAYIQNWISTLEKDPKKLFEAIKAAEKISDYILDHGPVALEKIRQEELQTCQEYVKAQVKEDFAHERITEEEYRHLTRNIDKMGSQLEESMNKENAEDRHEEYERIKTLELTASGLLLANEMALGEDLQIPAYTNNSVLTM